MTRNAGGPAAPRTCAWAGLHVLADDDPRWPIGPVAQGEAACEGGARVVQLRAKHATDREALAWARALRAVTRRHGVAFVVNDRFDLALASEADAVHLGQTDLPPDRVAAVAGGRLAIGRSTHTASQARVAREEPVDYVAFGPVFGTRSKASEYDARGLERLARIVAAVAPRPVVAIGGVGPGNLEDVIAAGAHGAAVISAVADARDPVAATRALAARFEARGTARSGAA
jgi:thiamine-phosphate pyrophosphorylase